MVVIHKIIKWLGWEGGLEDHLVPALKVSFVSTSGVSCLSITCSRV